MSEQELLDKIKQLEEENKTLKEILERGNSGNSSAYNAIRLMIIEKVQKEVSIPEDSEGWQKKKIRQKAERQIMRDLLWSIRVRRVTELRQEHIEPAREYIKNYKFKEVF